MSELKQKMLDPDTLHTGDWVAIRDRQGHYASGRITRYSQGGPAHKRQWIDLWCFNSNITFAEREAFDEQWGAWYTQGLTIEKRDGPNCSECGEPPHHHLVVCSLSS